MLLPPPSSPSPVPEHKPPLLGVDGFLIQLWPPDAAEVLASRLGIHPSLRALNFAMRSALRAAHLDLVFRLFSPDFLGDAAIVAFLVRACSVEGRLLDGLRLRRVRSWAALGRTKEQSSDGSASMAAAAARMSHSMALLGWSTPRRSWMS
ncbi:hypothetical protein OsI_24823 [Oryza sativa Indica Group]|nr:hypothetical protein OsI_24823 [Oryza sativa Indica Group]